MPVRRIVRWDSSLAESPGFVPDARARRQAGLPTAFGEDLRPCVELNHWVQEMAGFSKSAATIWTYLREVLRFQEFLRSEFGLDLLSPELEGAGALQAYKHTLLRPDLVDDSSMPVGDARSTLAKRRAAITSFYRFAVRRGLLDEIPFSVQRVRTRHGEREVLADLAAGGRRTLGRREPFPLEQVSCLLDYGCLGTGVDGAPDPSFLKYRTGARDAAAAALALAGGLRLSEVASFTLYELPIPTSDGLSPLRVAAAASKGGYGRNVIGFSDWLEVVWSYVLGGRRDGIGDGSWMPSRPLVLVDCETTASVATVEEGGKRVRVRWDALDGGARQRLVVPGKGSPLVFLNHHACEGRPILDQNLLSAAFRAARRRCSAQWPTKEWDLPFHSLRHTYGTRLARLLWKPDDEASRVEMSTGRRPAWATMIERENGSWLLQESMGHAHPSTTMRYVHSALMDALLAVNADPSLNPALDVR